MTNQMTREAFTKGFEHKWMCCEPLDVYDGPGSNKIGALDVGDVVVPDAETFDPDNKIVWRLKTPQEGGWIYAPVRGPKTCVPLTETTAKLVADGVTFYKVNGKKGTIVRREKELESDQVEIIPKDAVCHVVGEATLDNGKERFQINVPVEGWITKTQVTRTYIEKL